MPLNSVAKAALEDHIPLLQAGCHARRYGWQVDMNWETGLCHVRLQCPYRDGTAELQHTYLLRLSFDYYPIEQPGVVFVNPETRETGSANMFERWWPNIDGNPWIAIQITGDPATSYLCFQWTHEFKTTHSAPVAGDPKKWNPQRHTVVGVVRMVQRALSSRYYKGFRKT
jgi:hypothetical protein